MNVYKLFIFLIGLTLLTACNKYTRDKYPQLVSRPVHLQYINSCYSANFDDLSEISTKANNNIKTYLINRIGRNYYPNLDFEEGFIFSDAPIDFEKTNAENEVLKILGLDKEKSDCDTTIAFPVYSAIYQLRIPKIGIEKIGFHIMIDNNGNPLNDIDFPNRKSQITLIPIDSVHSELIRRRIPYKNLKIELIYDRKDDSLMWSTYTKISEGSIAGPSCFPEVQQHFKMNAITGEIIEDKNKFSGENTTHNRVGG